MNNNRNLGYVLIAAGLVLVIARFVGVNFMAHSWPLWIIAPGAFMLYNAFSGEKANLSMAVPGAIVTGTGLILLTMSITGRWEAWAYAWALYPTFGGVATYMVGKRNGDATLEKNGQRSAISGLYMLIGFGLFFELVAFGGLSGLLNSSIVPLALVAAGAYFLWSNGQLLPGGEKEKRKSKEENL